MSSQCVFKNVTNGKHKTKSELISEFGKWCYSECPDIPLIIDLWMMVAEYTVLYRTWTCNNENLMKDLLISNNSLNVEPSFRHGEMICGGGLEIGESASIYIDVIDEKKLNDFEFSIGVVFKPPSYVWQRVTIHNTMGGSTYLATATGYKYLKMNDIFYRIRVYRTLNGITLLVQSKSGKELESIYTIYHFDSFVPFVSFYVTNNYYNNLNNFIFTICSD
jgi:hypothetical protein